MLGQKYAALDTYELKADVPDTFEQRYGLYLQALSWFYDAVPNKQKQLGEDGLTLDEKLFDVETLAMHTVEQAAAGLQKEDLTSIYFHRTMGSTVQPRAFTLLFYDRFYAHGSQGLQHTARRYIFVCQLTGEDAPEQEHLLAQAHGRPTEPLYYVNFPRRQFAPVALSTLLFFPFEIGDEYQRQYLDQIIKQQYEAPLKCVKACAAATTGSHAEGCQPEAAIGSAKVIPRFNSRKHSEWELRVPITQPAPPCEKLPDAIIGFHEHDGHYWFAVVDLQGKLLELGEIPIPDHIGPRTKHGATSDNFAFELAHALIGQSQGSNYRARIGIEDTAWKRASVTTSSDQNRTTFSFPRQRIIKPTQQKATEAALLPPVVVSGVAPSRDYGRTSRHQDDWGNSTSQT